MAYQLFPYRYEKVIQFSNNTSSFEVYFGGKLGPVDYGVKIGNFGVSVFIFVNAIKNLKEVLDLFLEKTQPQ